MKLCRIILTSTVIIMVCGCAKSSDQLKACLENRNSLQIELATAQRVISELRLEKTKLQEDFDYQKTVSISVKTERDHQYKENELVKKLVRRAINEQFNALTSLMEHEELLDVIGGEILARKNTAGEDICLIDRERSVPAAGTLIGSWGYFIGPGTYKVQIIRPVEKDHIVVWESDLLTATEEGMKKFLFPAPVRVEKGDLIGFTFKGTVNVPYDLGTGATGYLSDRPSLGDKVKIEKISAEGDKRAYSIQVVGMLEV